MEILENLYELYLSGALSVKPKNRSARERGAVNGFIERCGLDEEQAEELNDLILDIIDSRGKQMFFDGHRAAFLAMRSAAQSKKADRGQV